MYKGEPGLEFIYSVILLSLWGGEKCAVWSLWSRKPDGERTPRDAAVLGRGQLFSFSQFSVFYSMVMFLMQKHFFKKLHPIS